MYGRMREPRGHGEHGVEVVHLHEADEDFEEASENGATSLQVFDGENGRRHPATHGVETSNHRQDMGGTPLLVLLGPALVQQLMCGDASEQLGVEERQLPRDLQRRPLHELEVCGPSVLLAGDGGAHGGGRFLPCVALLGAAQRLGQRPEKHATETRLDVDEMCVDGREQTRHKRIGEVHRVGFDPELECVGDLETASLVELSAALGAIALTQTRRTILSLQHVCGCARRCRTHISKCLLHLSHSRRQKLKLGDEEMQQLERVQERTVGQEEVLFVCGSQEIRAK
mmetsp:Transcript_42972/g.93355  ORF Transcript_42972/g.93355 Transcript_42972/m.93355 type:complete len:285 (-) Transcript_42972:796-1650(-)